jgi:ribosome maturation factor RimP
MSLVLNLTELLTPAVRDAGFVLEEVKVTPAGKRRIIAVIIDGLERNPSLDEVTVVSRIVSEILDNYSQLGEMPFTLEVTTPGVDRPLTQPRHWRKNIGRLVKVTPIEGEIFTSRILSVSETSVTLEDRDIEFSRIKRAQVEIEFNRKEKR